MPKKAWAIAAGAVAVALTLSGCGRGADEAPEKAGEIDLDNASGTVEVWAMGTEGELLQDFVAPFEQETGIKVNVTLIPWESVDDKLSTALATGKTPDISQVGTTSMGQLAATGGLDVVPEGVLDADSFLPGALESTKVGGTAYAAPWYVETRLLYFRKDLAAQAGLEDPTSWEQLAAWSAGLQSRTGKWGVWYKPESSQFHQFVWQAGASYTNDAQTEFTLDTPEFVQALSYFQDIFTSGSSPTDLTQDDDVRAAFVRGELGAYMSGPWEVNLLKDAGIWDETGLALLPAGMQKASLLGGSNLAVFKEAPNRSAAWKLVQWMSRPETQVAWYEASSDLPATSAAWDDDALTSDPVVAVFGTQLEVAVAPPSIPTWREFYTLLDSELERLATGSVTPEDVARELQQKADKLGTGLS